MPYFVPDNSTSLPVPDFYQGFYLEPSPETGHTLHGSLEEFWNWYDYQPSQVVLLDSYFRESLISCQSWQAWSNTNPPARYAELAAAAMCGAWFPAQRIYNAIKVENPPPLNSINEWQAMARAYNIPLTF